MLTLSTWVYCQVPKIGGCESIRLGRRISDEANNKGAGGEGGKTICLSNAGSRLLR